MSERVRIGVVIGSTRPNRAGEKVARWFHGLAAARPELDAALLDLRDVPLPLYDEPKPPVVAEQAYASEVARRWVATVAGLDGVVLVTPEYNHSFPAALKNALDWVYAGWVGKPMACVSYGGLGGGIRAVQQLRQVAVELQMVPLRDEVNISAVFRAFDDDGQPLDPALAVRAAVLLDQLEWWARALRDARAARPMPERRRR
jgi:NAD(P)H-dependent FMN reductase